MIGLMLFLAGVSAVAQTVTGRVTSAADGSAIPGASILVKGTTTGAATDADGKYTLSVANPANAVLVVSYIGFKTSEVAVQGRSQVDISLDEDVATLGEVVVTALGISREAKTLVYATQQVKPSTLTEVRDANNVLNSLQGKLANVVITQGSGGVGSGARIVLRGNRSIQGSNNALIVVDGVPINNGTNGTVTSDFGGVQGTDGASNINPDDIESMTVLRGASAAALYGSAAGNGVILITTKKGHKDRIQVTVNSGVTTERPFVLPDLQNEYGQGNSGVLSGTSGESWGAKMTGQSFSGLYGNRTYSAQPDNVKDFFRTGLSLNNSIGVSGGSEKMQTYLSYTNNMVQGIMPRNDLSRHTFNMRITNNISKKLTTDAKLTYIMQDIQSKYSTGEGGPVMELYQIPRNVALSDAKNYETYSLGQPVPAPYPVINPALYQNPYWRVNRSENNESRNRVMGFALARYELADWLHITGRANIDKISDNLESLAYQGTLGISGSGGAYSISKIDVTQRWFDLILSGSRKLGSDLKIEYRGGAILQDTKTTNLFAAANGLNIPNKFSLNFATNRNYGQGEVQVQTQSLFAQANLAYKDAIFFDASIRRDWDSRLPSPYSFNYPSAGLSAVLSDLMELPSAFSFLKVNANYAVVGNGGQPQIRFNTFGYSQGAGAGFISRAQTQAIANLKPEIVRNIEVGLEGKLLENRLGFTLTYYKSNSFNQLLRIKLPVASGFYDKYVNAGNIQNQGVEFTIDGTPIKSGDFAWEVGFNFGLNRNKVVELSDDLKEVAVSEAGFGRSATPIVAEGGSYGDMKGFVWLRENDLKTGDAKAHTGSYVVTSDGRPLTSLTTGELQYIGNFNPRATLGLSNTFSYKSLNVRVLVDGRVGGTIVDGTEQLLAYNGAPAITAENREGGWNLGGVSSSGAAVNTTINSQAFWTTASGGRYGTAEFFTYDATNFRIRELSVGYDLPIPDNFVIKSARLSVVARNLLFLYRGSAKLDIPGLPKRKMSFDPDMALGNGNWQGISYGTMPSTRSIGFNLQLTF